MPKPPVSALQKILKQQQALQKAEEKYKEALGARKDEIFDLFVECKATTTIDDSLLAGFLLYATNEDNKNNPLFLEMKELAKAAKIPSKPKHPNKKPAKKNS